ncbi:MAG: type III pantothenate kinase [Chloroflexota bacterium]|nr:type III pantothenate kinase [Chloroflexota bacterium]
MRLLAADIGNTNLSLGLFDGSEPVGSWRATTEPTATADEVATLLVGLLALDGHGLEEIEAVALASVVPSMTETFSRAIRLRTRRVPVILDATSLGGILAIEIDRPSEAGADRLVNALAARVEFGGPAIVVDLGTSTNFDVLSAEGAYLGGAIAPGLGLSLEALVEYASKLPRIELRRPPHAIGSNTVHAMQSGSVLGYIGLVSGLLAALRSELAERSPAGARVTVVATGGYTYEPWLADVPGIDAVEPDLTLRGIRYAWEAMRGGTGPAAAAEATDAIGDATEARAEARR